jgi:signal transduction histidine kinase
MRRCAPMTAGTRRLERAPAWPIGLGIALTAFALGLVAEHMAHSWEQPAWIPIADLAVGWLMVACGLIAAAARPDQPAGWRLVLAGFLWFVGTFMGSDNETVRGLGFAFWGYQDLVLIWLALSYPGRAPTNPVARGALVVAAVLYVVQTLSRLAMSGPDAFGVTIVDPEAALAVVLRVDVARAAAIVACGIVALALLVRSSPAQRRTSGLVLAAGAASALAGAWTAWYALTTLGLVPALGDDLVVPIAWAFNVVRVVVPLAILVGILRGQAARSAIVSAVVRVGEKPSAESLRDALATALSDDGLRILKWDAPSGTYRDGGVASLTAAEVDAAVGAREVAVVNDGTERLAVIAFGRGRPDDPALVEAGVAVTRLFVANERLSAQIQEQLDDVRASRARIVEAADVERRRIERDLHDGLQQRMVALAMDLSAADRDGADQAAVLRHGSAEVLALLSDVRELARGIHPAVLSEAGLGAAIRAAADRSPVPAEVTLELSGAGTPAAQATAYFVVSEALANVAKHAGDRATAVWVTASDGAGTLAVTIEDDGQGGADPDGHGLAGLADRVAALDGRFAVRPRPGGGTRVTAEIPVG